MSNARSSRERTRRYRERLRQQGLRRIELWVLDVDTPEFITEARRQSLAVANSPHEEKDQAFVDAICEGTFK